MKIEKLNEDKIRITLDMNDLEENNIDFHSFMSNSLDSQSLFLEMLARAEKEYGFVTKDYRIMIEALATFEGNFIITVTRIVPEKEPVKRKKVKIHRKIPKFDTDVAIYEFKTFDDFCDFCRYLDDMYAEIFKKSVTSSILYYYDSSYFLILKNLNSNSKQLKNFCSYITEFAVYIHNSKLFSKKLSEYGKIIMKKNAIKTCQKHFNKI